MLHSSKTPAASCAAFHVVPRKGNPPVLTFQEEADIAWWAFSMVEKGCARGRHLVDAEIVRLSKGNHAEHTVTKGIMLHGLSDEVFTGFKWRWDYLMTNHFSDPMNGQRRALNNDDVEIFYANVDANVNRQHHLSQYSSTWHSTLCPLSVWPCLCMALSMLTPLLGTTIEWLHCRP